MRVPEGRGGKVEEVEELERDVVVEEDGVEVGRITVLEEEEEEEEDVGVGVGVEVTIGASPQRPYCG